MRLPMNRLRKYLLSHARTYHRVIACNRFAHRKCILGALNTDQRFGDSVAQAPAETCDVACGESWNENVADAGTQTIEIPTTEVASGPESIYVDGCCQTSVVTCDVGSGEETLYVDSCCQTSVVTCDVGSGEETVYVDSCCQTSVVTCDVGSGEETVYVDSCCQTNVVTCDVGSGGETVHVDVVPEVAVATGIVAELSSVVSPEIEATASTSTATATRRSSENTNESTLWRTLKYWKLRYNLFSKFDHGIMLDEVSMYSVCPEVLAIHMAKRCSVGTVLDPFCGAGGNAIQLAFSCAHVIAIDSDPNKIMLAKKNAEIYGVADRIDFRVGDSFRLAADLRVDAVVTSPPWGGPGYRRSSKFDARDLGNRETGGLKSILEMVHAVAPKVLLHVPKNMDRAQCLQMATTGFGRIQFESVTIDQRPNCLNLYLTRNDTHAQGLPVQTFRHINLNTQPAIGMQRAYRLRNDNLRSYANYIESVTQFLAN